LPAGAIFPLFLPLISNTQRPSISFYLYKTCRVVLFFCFFSFCFLSFPERYLLKKILSPQPLAWHVRLCVKSRDLLVSLFLILLSDPAGSLLFSFLGPRTPAVRHQDSPADTTLSPLEQTFFCSNRRELFPLSIPPIPVCMSLSCTLRRGPCRSLPDPPKNHSHLQNG